MTKSDLYREPSPARADGGFQVATDAELLELGHQYMAIEAAIMAADAIVAASNDQEPVPRDVMRHQIEDHLCGFQLPMDPTLIRSTPTPKSARYIRLTRSTN